MQRTGIGHWDRLFEAGGFAVTKRFTVSLEYHLAFFTERLSLLVQRALFPLLRRYGATRLAVLLGDSYYLVARKREWTPSMSTDGPRGR